MNVSTKKTGAGNFALYIVLFLVLLVLNGFMNFVAAEFSTEILASATYWMKTATGSASGLAAFIIFSFFKRDHRVLKDEDYNTKLTGVKTAISGQVGPDFIDFISEKNYLSKTLRWQEIQQNKLIKWNNKIPSKVLRNIKRLEDEPNWPNKTKWKKRKKLAFFLWGRHFWFFAKRRANKWTRKRDTINLQLSTEWIAENMNYVKIEYPETTPGEIINGQRSSSNNKVIDNGAISHILRDRLPMISIIIILQAGFNALVISGSSDPVGLWMGIIFQLATMLLNVATGTAYGNKLFAVLDLNNLTTREQYLMEYLIWKKRPVKVKEELTPKI